MKTTLLSLRLSWWFYPLILLLGASVEPMRGAAPLISPLPEEIMRVLVKEFPGGKVTGFGREREMGIWLFEVRVRKGREKYGVEITRDGGLVEISRSIAVTELPPQIAVLVRTRLKPVRVLRVERTERRGTVRTGQYKALKAPRIVYEISYIGLDRRRYRKQLDSNGVLELPATVLAVLNSRFKGARITEVELDAEGAEDRFHIQLLTPAKARIETVMDSRGRILEMEYPIRFAALPAAAAKRLRGDRSLRTAVKTEVRRRDVYDFHPRRSSRSRGKTPARAGTPKATATYVATVYDRRGRMCEFRFDERGRLTASSPWERAPKPREDEDGD